MQLKPKLIIFFVLLYATSLNAEVLIYRPVPVPKIEMEDQFQKPYRLDNYKGDVVILLFGDKEGADANKLLGQAIHESFHPQAKGKNPGQARFAPVLEIVNQPPGTRAPEVHTIAVASIGKVPNLVKVFIRNQFQKASPEVPVWLDFNETMRTTFKFKPSSANLVVIDPQGNLRLSASGNLTQVEFTDLVNAIEGIRVESVNAQITPKAP